ncbi:MAG: ArsR family transcriptional regulator [Acidimicrobiia bacterium]|nr:ArsR family transcriptional regulator [Acidimicrobiia bacterium]
MDTSVAGLSPAQRTVLMELKRLGEATADELAAKLDISPSAVRQHLSALRSAEVVTSQRQRGQLGRPAERYVATEQAEPMSGGEDSRLSIEILEQVEAEDPDLVARIFDRRRSGLVERCRQRVAGKPVDERVDVVAQLLDEQGYLADLEKVDDGHYRINLRSCAIWPVASRYRQACNAELTFIQDLLPDAAVNRVTHKTAGAHTCVYEVHIAS